MEKLNVYINKKAEARVLNNHPWVFTSDITKTDENIKNGDIVIVNNDNPALEKVIVKRVIATEGQTVDIDFDSGEVKVDGKVLQEDYINNLTLLDEGGHNYPVTVPENCVFVMGDNRMNSTDSRSPLVGFVPEDEILGKVSLRIFPFSRFGVPA